MATVNSKKVTPVSKRKVQPEKIKPKQYPVYEDNEGDEQEYLNLSEIINSKLHNQDCYNITRYQSEKNSVNFEFEAEASEYTCGFLELGNLATDVKHTSPEKVAQLSNLLDEIVTCAKGYTLFINTNGDRDCITIAKALSISKNWVKVTTYLNPGSGNMLTLWVTNN